MKIKSLLITAVLATAFLCVVVAPITTKAACSAGNEITCQINALMDQIKALQEQITQLKAQQDQGQTWCYTFNKNLRIGDSGQEVSELVTALAKNGILLNEATKYDFNEDVASGIVEFQEKYASEILTPNGLRRGNGYAGPGTRKKLNALYGCKVVCIQDAKQCPDGSYVSRTGPKCEFTKCPETKCTDSDGGKDYYTKGSISWMNEQGKKQYSEDKCPSVGDPNYGVLQEVYCTEDGLSAGIGFICPNGCENGACKQVTTQPSIAIISPNGGETYKTGDSITVNWKTANVSSLQKFDVIRLRVYPNGQEYNLAYSVLNDGQELITLPSSVPVGAYTLEIKTYIDNILVFDASDSYFKIVPLAAQCTSDADCPSVCPTCTSIWGPCGPCIISKCVDGKCVASDSQPGGPLNVKLDGGTPVGQNLNIGQTNVVFARIQLNNTTLRAINNMNGIQIASNSYLASATLTNIKIYDDSTNTQIGSTATSLTNNGNYYYAWVNISGFSIPAYTTKALRIIADIKPDAPVTTATSGATNLGIAGLNFDQPGCTTTGMPVYGNGMTIVSKTCPTVNCFVDNCPGKHLPDSNGCTNCSTPCSTIQPYITVTSPNGGETWKVGEMYGISWKSTGVNKVNIIAKNITDGSSYSIGEDIVPSYPTSSYGWTAGKNYGGFTMTTGQYKIEISDDVNGANPDASDNYFSINPASLKPITVLYPNGGEKLEKAKTYTIKWNVGSFPIDSRIDLALSLDGSETPIITTTNTGSYNWTIPISVKDSSSYVLYIRQGDSTASYGNGRFDTSYTYFSIVASTTQLSITVTSPNGGETFQLGSQIPISWNDPTKAGSVGIWLLNSDKSTVGVIGQGKPSPDVSNTFFWDGTTVCQGFSGYVGSNCSKMSVGSYIIRVLSNTGDASGRNLVDESDSYFKIVNYDACRLDKLDGTNITRNAIYNQTDCLSQLCDIYGPANLNQMSSRCVFNGVEIKRYTQTTQACTSGQRQVCGQPQGGGYSGNQICVNGAWSDCRIITVTSPNSGETWKVGETHNITWTLTGIDSSASVGIALVSNPAGPPVENSPFVITNNSGSYAWTIPSGTSPGSYKISVTGTADPVYIDGWSDYAFTIVAPTTVTCTGPSASSINYSQRATSSNSKGESYVDSCVSGPGLNYNVIKGYCGPDGNILKAYYMCPNGCSNGVCSAGLGANISQSSLASISDMIQRIAQQIQALMAQ